MKGNSSSTRDPNSLASCTQLLKSLWSPSTDFSTQQEFLHRLHIDAIEVSNDWYERGILHNKGLNSIETRVLKLNLEEMDGVKRGEGVPYSSHPIKLSNLVREILGSDSEEAKQTFLYTMIHDVLEEGKGTSIDSFKRLKDQFPNHPLVADASFILVEPDIRSISIPEDMRYSMIEVVGYSRQIEFYANDRNDRAIYNSSLVDKLFNLFDRYAAVSNGVVEEEDFMTRMQWRLAKQGYLLEKMENKGHPDLVRYAKALHNNLRAKLKIKKSEVASKIMAYKEIESRYADEIDDIIVREAAARGLLSL